MCKEEMKSYVILKGDYFHTQRSKEKFKKQRK